MANEPRFEVYPRKRRRTYWGTTKTEYGWRFRAANGQITAVGGEGFTRRVDAVRAIHDFQRDMRTQEGDDGRFLATIIDVEV